MITKEIVEQLHIGQDKKMQDLNAKFEKFLIEHSVPLQKGAEIIAEQKVMYKKIGIINGKKVVIVRKAAA